MDATVSEAPRTTAPQAQQRDWRGWLLALSTLVIWADRLSKRWIEKHLAVGHARMTRQPNLQHERLKPMTR